MQFRWKYLLRAGALAAIVGGFAAQPVGAQLFVKDPDFKAIPVADRKAMAGYYKAWLVELGAAFRPVTKE